MKHNLLSSASNYFFTGPPYFTRWLDRDDPSGLEDAEGHADMLRSYVSDCIIICVVWAQTVLLGSFVYKYFNGLSFKHRFLGSFTTVWLRHGDWCRMPRGRGWWHSHARHGQSTDLQAWLRVHYSGFNMWEWTKSALSRLWGPLRMPALIWTTYERRSSDCYDESRMMTL